MTYFGTLSKTILVGFGATFVTLLLGTMFLVGQTTREDGFTLLLGLLLLNLSLATSLLGISALTIARAFYTMRTERRMSADPMDGILMTVEANSASTEVDITLCSSKLSEKDTTPYIYWGQTWDSWVVTGWGLPTQTTSPRFTTRDGPTK